MKVSVVTPSFNQGQFIERTLQSVAIQSGAEIEHFVVDGGSTDNTIDVLRRSGHGIRWISEKDKGQADAAHALGMSSGLAMRRVILPQAMRVIVPPTGNETIAMVKDTSLFIAANIITELFYQTTLFGSRSFKIIPGLMAATLWYLIVCSVLMVGQSYLEKYFGRGYGAVPKKTQQKIMKIEADH